MKTKFVIRAAIVAALYAALTLVLSPLSYGPMQVRISEALTVLPALMPESVPGLCIGCFISNLIGPYGIIDAALGAAATLAGALGAYWLRKHQWLVPLPTVIANAVIIGCELHYIDAIPNLWACMAWIALGEAIACYALGIPLLKLLNKRKGLLS